VRRTRRQYAHQNRIVPIQGNIVLLLLADNNPISFAVGETSTATLHRPTIQRQIVAGYRALHYITVNNACQGIHIELSACVAVTGRQNA